MHRPRLSNRSSTWNGANATLFGATSETIDLMKGESQRRTFRQSADGGNHDSARCENLINIVNDEGEKSPYVHGAPSLTLF